MITKLNIQNFKSIEALELNFKPITIFTGPNGSGKSNILEAIGLIAQTVKLPPSERNFSSSLTKGEFYSYGAPKYEYIAHKGNLRKNILLGMHLSTTIKEQNLIHRLFRKFQDLEIITTPSSQSVGYGFSVRPGPDPYSVRGLTQQIFIGEQKVMEIYLKRSNGSQSFFRYPKKIDGVLAGDPMKLFNKESFKPNAKGEQITAIGLKGTFYDGVYALAGVILKLLKGKLQYFYPISGIRGIVESVVEAKGTPTWVGMRGENLVYILSYLGRVKNRMKKEKIIKWSKEFGMKDFSASYVEDRRIVPEYEDSKFRIPLNLSLASFGSKQVLPIIVQLFWSVSGSVITIEEPEISLHPQAQVNLMPLFAEAVKENKQIICTTHSPFLILALSRVIKSKKLSLDDITVYHVSKGEKGTQAKQLPINEQGYIPGWIESYAKVEDDLFKEWADNLDDE